MTTNTKKTTEKLIEYIVNKIEENNILPWNSGLLNSEIFPRNYISKKNYHGINSILLSFFSLTNKNCTQEWVTYLQAKSKGGNVKRGEKGLPIIYFSEWDKERKCIPDEKSKKEDITTITRSSTVFEISQCNGLESHREFQEIDHPSINEIDDLIETFANKTELTLELEKTGGNGFYSPSKHLVSVAALKYYKTKEDYYSTLFHELIHSTKNAMNRVASTSFGSETYSQEEIVAETGAMLLCKEFGLAKTPRDNSIVYVKGWGENLKKNPSWLIKGVSDAEKAVKYFFKTIGYTPQNI